MLAGGSPHYAAQIFESSGLEACRRGLLADESGLGVIKDCH